MDPKDLTPEQRLGLLTPRQRQVLEIWCSHRDFDFQALSHSIEAELNMSYQRAGQHIDRIKKKLVDDPLDYCQLLAEPQAEVPPEIRDAFAAEDAEPEEDQAFPLGRPTYVDPGDPPSRPWFWQQLTPIQLVALGAVVPSLVALGLLFLLLTRPNPIPPAPVAPSAPGTQLPTPAPTSPPAAVPVAQPTPQPTAIPTIPPAATSIPPTPTQRPLPSPTPSPVPPGELIYKAADFADWPVSAPGTPGWKRRDNTLVSDNTIRRFQPIFAPVTLYNTDYSIMASIEVLDKDYSSTGIIARTGYFFGPRCCSDQLAIGRVTTPNVYVDIATKAKVHIPRRTSYDYVADLKGTLLTLTVNNVGFDTNDTTFDIPGKVGIWADDVQIIVHNFKVTAL
jgi:hypothetical protein